MCAHALPCWRNEVKQGQRRIGLRLKSLCHLQAVFFLIFGGEAVSAAPAASMDRQDATEFRQAVAQARPGSRILLAPGTYSGGFHFAKVQGVSNQPVVIAAADPEQTTFVSAVRHRDAPGGRRPLSRATI